MIVPRVLSQGLGTLGYSCKLLLSGEVPLGQHQALSSHLSLQVAIIGKERKGLGGEFGLPAWCQAQLRTHSRCFVSSCAIGVHIFHLFFPSSSDLSLKTQKELLFSGQECPAQPKTP